MVGQRRGESARDRVRGSSVAGLVDDALTCARTITRRLGRLGAMAGLGVLASACAVDDFGISTGPRDGFAADHRSTAIAGAWVSSSYVRTAAGLHANEVIWEFRNDGWVTRTSTLRNITTGLATTEVMIGNWAVQGQWLTVRLEPPHTGTIRLRFSVHGDQLLLDSQEFQRIR